jgi:hypothetical protein
MSQPIINFEFESINLVSDWNYNCINSLCPICNTTIYDEPPKKSKKSKKSNKVCNKFNNIVNTNIVKGECNHAFHRGCIKNYLKKNTICPVCPENTQYKFKQNLEDVSSIKLFKN